MVQSKSRSGDFYVSPLLLGLGVFFVAFHSVRAFLRQFELATSRKLSVSPKRRSRHFYFSTVDGSILLLFGESARRAHGSTRHHASLPLLPSRPIAADAA